jgi:nitrite reductase/ring-hydroxylating ferredoxin subunit
MTLVDVGAVDEFMPDKLRIISVNDREVGVLSWQGRWYALRNICPHLGAPLCTGPVRPLLTQESVTSKDLTVELDRPVIMCPWHHWEFDIASGVSVTGRERVKTYRVEIEEGRVKLDLGTPAAPA